MNLSNSPLKPFEPMATSTDLVAMNPICYLYSTFDLIPSFCLQASLPFAEEGLHSESRPSCTQCISACGKIWALHERKYLIPKKHILCSEGLPLWLIERSVSRKNEKNSKHCLHKYFLLSDLNLPLILHCVWGEQFPLSTSLCPHSINHQTLS